ncbi:MAG: hypothetical protein US09_C0005G0010 [Candidatus Moranbacteria bacterium GW2011_GWD1_36_198]|nr:MAG: hypothetical protein US09_C0005G0010 [Candidatus Moranbacteria bacterium GW2011_GWD1_36_198]
MKGWICALFIILACAQPTSSRAYFKYVPPQPPAKRYKVVKTLPVIVSRYIEPKREYYKSKRAYLDAIKLNGKGKETFFGTKPQADFTIAANVTRKHGFRRGTIIRIKGDGINLIGKVDDRCVAAEELWKDEKIVQFDVFSKMSQKQADAWGKRKMTVEILKVI